MKPNYRLSIAAALLATSLSFAAPAPSGSSAYPEIGSWKLDAARSKFEPGPGPRSQTRLIEATPEGIKLTIQQQLANGQRMSLVTTYHYDGKSYPFTGLPGIDGLSIRRTSRRHAVFDLLNAGQIVGHGTVILSHHDTLMTVDERLKRAGTEQHLLEVLERQ